MTRTNGDKVVVPDGPGVADNRVRFLSTEAVDHGRVRPPILASWERSRSLRLPADRIELPYLQDPEVDTPLTRTALPVLLDLREQLDGQPVSVVLTDPSGLVLSRLTGDHDLERHLDSVLLAPGFSYAEKFVGTNGIGTALEIGDATRVFGHEHYAENLERLACAGVPIQHPVTGRTVGAIDLTCWRRDAGPLLLTLAKTTAEQIRQALLADTGAQQLELFHEYLRTCRRTPGPVFALGDEVVMMNDHARSVLDPTDQALLIAQAGEAMAIGDRGCVVVQLPTGTAARMYFRPVGRGARPGRGPAPSGSPGAGLVVHVKLEERPGPAHAGSHSGGYVALPGLVGSAPVWLRACQEIERDFRSGEWLALQGEPGVGKLALLKAVQLRRQPVGRLTVLDAVDADADRHWLATVRQALATEADGFVIQHVDTLTAHHTRALSAALQETRRTTGNGSPWVAVTLDHAQETKELAALLRLFPSTVQVPPLRIHLEDLPQLTSFFLARLHHGGHLTCSPEAMQLLMRSPWPGNVEQLHRLLRQVVKHRRSGAIQPEDLPAEVRTVSRRRLSRLEGLERDAIVQSLVEAKGNKVQAAKALEMSRATIYRKIREYGIVPPGG